MSAKKQNPQGNSNPFLNEVGAEWNSEDAELLQGMFSFDMQSQAIPALVIVQALSTGIPDYRKHLGEIYNTVTGEFHQRLELIFIGNNTPRAVLPYPYSKEAPQICASVDGITPYAKYIGTEITAANDWDEQSFIVPEACEECPLFESPLCAKMFRYFGITPHNGLIFTLRLKRSGMDAAKKLNFWLNQLGQRGMYKSFYMSTTEQSAAQGGSYFVPVFDVGNDAKDMLRQAYELNQALAEKIRRVGQAQLKTGEFEE